MHSFISASNLTNSFSIGALLQNSLYYPSSHFDGSIVKAYSKDYQSFVYCDYGVTEADLIARIETFRGYDVLEHRPVQKEELIPNGWEPQIPHRLLTNYGKYADWDVIKPPFAYWVLYNRKPEYSDLHGPTQFSLLFVGGEGVATYQALYWSNGLTPKAIAIVQPDTGFGFNWTNFLDGDKALGYVAIQNPHGQPDFIIASAPNLLKWRNYPRHSAERSCRVSRDSFRTFYEFPRT